MHIPTGTTQIFKRLTAADGEEVDTLLQSWAVYVIAKVMYKAISVTIPWGGFASMMFKHAVKVARTCHFSLKELKII
jgi:hypothetical protein